MLTLDEFKNRYSNQIKDLQMSDLEILQSYEVYSEDPLEFHESMLG